MASTFVINVLQEFGVVKSVIGLVSIFVFTRWFRRALVALRSPFPGPLLAKLTSWYLRYHEYNGTRKVFIEQCHQTYGDSVIIAPNEISFRDADALRTIFAKARLDQPAGSAILQQFGQPNVVSTITAPLNQERRKLVSSVYSAPTIVSTESQERFKLLVDRLSEQINQEISSEQRFVDVYPLLRYLACDLMSHIVFGTQRSLDSLSCGEDRKRVKFILLPVPDILSSMSVLLMSWYPKIMTVLFRQSWFPDAQKGFQNESTGIHQYALAMAKKAIDDPRLTDGAVPYHAAELVRRFNKDGASRAIPNPTYIASDCMDHFFAGSLTTADALSWMAWRMALPENRERQLRLRKELWDAGVTPGCTLNLSVILKLPYLHDVIRETLRRDPPIPFSSKRHVKVGQQVVIDGHAIPAGIIASAQAYSVHRNPKAFPNAEEWNPERWDLPTETAQAREMGRHFWPFGSGQRMCIGMHIAWAELRLVVARLYSTYDISLGDAYLGPDKKMLADIDRQHLFPYTSQEPLHLETLTFHC